MKTTLLLLSLFVALTISAQDLRNNTYDINYVGKSTYTIHKEAWTGLVRLKKLHKRCIKAIDEWTQSLNARYEVINVDNVKTGLGITPKVTVTFKLLRQDGTEWLTRDDAITKLKEYKELFEMGAISETEFEKVKNELILIIKE